MRDFDEDRPSITGRKISSNIPPTVEGYVQFRPWLPWLVAAIAVPIVVLVVIVLVAR
jgi:hypothetical protein